MKEVDGCLCQLSVLASAFIVRSDALPASRSVTVLQSIPCGDRAIALLRELHARLAECYTATGRSTEALALITPVYRFFLHSVGPDHSETRATRQILEGARRPFFRELEGALERRIEWLLGCRGIRQLLGRWTPPPTDQVGARPNR